MSDVHMHGSQSFWVFGLAPTPPHTYMLNYGGMNGGK